MARTVGHALCGSLIEHGVDTVFCVPGESYIGLINALSGVAELRVIVCRHEGGAGFMALADGQLRGRAGVCIVSRGPGLSNALIALHSALHDTEPLVMLIGQVERADTGRMALQEQNYSRLLADVTKSVIEVSVPDRASEAIARAFHIAESGTRGPVAVILPEDIFDEETAAVTAKRRPAPLMTPGPDEVGRLATLLMEASRPLVWVGGALVRDARTLGNLARLAETWGLPVAPTHRRPHLFATAHPNYAGHVGIRPPRNLMERMREADLLVALGERLTDTVSQGYTFPTAPEPQLPLVHIWPDPEEIGRVWRPHLAIACGPAAMIDALLERAAPEISEVRRAWVAGLNETARRIAAPEWEPTSDGVNFAAVVCGVNGHLAANAVITSDAGNFGSFLQRYLEVRIGQVFLSSIVGAMGAGVPMAVAASLRYPGRQVVAFVGDGGILMTGNELATARMYGCNPVIILSDNGCYSTIAMHQLVRYPGNETQAFTGLLNPDFVAWARSFGAEAFVVRSEAEIPDVLGAAFAIRDKPVLVHVLSSAEQMGAWRRRKDGNRVT